MVEECKWEIKTFGKKRALSSGPGIKIWLLTEDQLMARSLRALIKLKDILIRLKIHEDTWHGNILHTTATPEAIRAADYLKHALNRVIAKKRENIERQNHN